jgi:hypothetical protein
MNEAQKPNAGVIPVDGKVRPRCWANINKAGDVTHHANNRSSWADSPLYDQAAIDAAVEQAIARNNAAWRLMCEKMVAAEREKSPRFNAVRALEAWDSTVLPKNYDGMMFERMEELRAALEAQLKAEPATTASRY